MEISLTAGIDTRDIADQIDLDDIASCFDYDSIACCIDLERVANEIDTHDLALEVDKACLASHIDLGSLAKELIAAHGNSGGVAARPVAEQYPMLYGGTALFEAMTEAIIDVGRDMCDEDTDARQLGQVRMLGMMSALMTCLGGVMASVRRDLNGKEIPNG